MNAREIVTYVNRTSPVYRARIVDGGIFFYRGEAIAAVLAPEFDGTGYILMGRWMLPEDVVATLPLGVRVRDSRG